MNTVEITEQNFEEEVYNSNIPVILDFYSDGCIACERIDEELKELTSIYGNSVKIARLNIENNRQIASICRIQCTPTLIFFNEGDIVDVIEGWKNSNILQEHVNKLL